jgi:tetratricopeptide (TPR) repeat protein
MMKPKFAAMSQSAGRIISYASCRAVIAISLLTLAAAPALAAGKQAKERAARKACLNGDYAKGVSILSELFVDTKDPTYLFNQGRCFEQNHRYEDALSRFEEYLRAPEEKLGVADRAAAEKHIEDCKSRLPDQSSKSQASAPQPFVPLPPTLAGPSESTSTSESSTSIAAEPEQQPSPAHSRSGLRVAGIVTASVGVAAAVAGVLLNLKANSMADSMSTTVGDYKARDTSRKNYQTMAWIGYGAGAACVVTGAILYGFGLRGGGNSSTSVALLPAIGPGQAGALLTGGF